MFFNLDNKMNKIFGEIKIGQKFNFKLAKEFGMETFIKISETHAKLEQLINGCQFSYEFKSDEIVGII